MAETFLAITFKDDTTIYGRTATEVLENLTGGFNPPTVSELRQAFMRRAGCYVPDYDDCSNLQFLKLCGSSPINLWKFFENVERPFPVSHANGSSWAVTAQLPKRPAIAR